MSSLHSTLFPSLSVAPFPPPSSDGPARLPVLSAGEPRRLP
jgi:hypothetical protein